MNRCVGVGGGRHYVEDCTADCPLQAERIKEPVQQVSAGTNAHLPQAMLVIQMPGTQTALMPKHGGCSGQSIVAQAVH